MKRLLLLLLASAFVGVTYGVTVAWQLPKGHTEGWAVDESYDSTITTVTLVTSATMYDSITKFVNDATETPSGFTKIASSTAGDNLPAVNVVPTSLDLNKAPGVWASNINLTGSGYIFVIVQNAQKQYMVARAAQYTANDDSGTVTGNGIYNDNVHQKPDLGQFMDITVVGGTWEAATPEPTALALLALGLVGFALRRRV